MTLARRNFLKLIPAAGVLASCGGNASKIRLALNWKPDPEFGGFYAADYAKYRLNVEILPGGAGTPTVQMVGAGSAEFGIVSGDEILLARARGNDVVALFAVFQQNPMAIMTRASRHLTSIEDILKGGGTLALQRGLAYARLLQKRYGFDHVKIVPAPGGDLTPFLHDEKFAQQTYIFDEPLRARRRGIAVSVFPLSEIGFNPYTTVLVTSGDYLRKNSGASKNMVDATREGWRVYLDNPAPTNDRMRALNPTIDPAGYADIAALQKPLVEAATLGMMTKERWQTMADQLKEIGDIPDASIADACFKNL